MVRVLQIIYYKNESSLHGTRHEELRHGAYQIGTNPMPACLAGILHA
jgi:hypothetical protein